MDRTVALGRAARDEIEAVAGMIIERAGSSSPRDDLAYRLKQQKLLAEFGRMALQVEDPQDLLQRAVELCAKGLNAPYCKVLEYQANRDLLVMQAGIGWNVADIGIATLGADMESPAGFAFHAKEAVVSNHLLDETRFRTPKLLKDYGIRRAVNVLIDRGGRTQNAYGVLEVDSPDPGQFDEADVEFLSGCAGILGVAIERHQTDLKLQELLSDQALLTREMSHRVKNSLGVVASLLRLGANLVSDPGAHSAMLDAETRVMTIARVHDHLWRSSRIGDVDLGTFLEDLCRNLSEAVTEAEIRCTADTAVVNADSAIPVGLIVNELVTNAGKYAYAPGHIGAIEVTLVRDASDITIAVADRGRGLPEGFDINAKRPSFGMRVIGNLVKQLNGVLTIEPLEPGVRFTLRFVASATPDR